MPGRVQRRGPESASVVESGEYYALYPMVGDLIVKIVGREGSKFIVEFVQIPKEMSFDDTNFEIGSEMLVTSRQLSYRQDIRAGRYYETEHGIVEAVSTPASEYSSVKCRCSDSGREWHFYTTQLGRLFSAKQLEEIKAGKAKALASHKQGVEEICDKYPWLKAEKK